MEIHQVNKKPDKCESDSRTEYKPVGTVPPTSKVLSFTSGLEHPNINFDSRPYRTLSVSSPWRHCVLFSINCVMGIFKSKTYSILTADVTLGTPCLACRRPWTLMAGGDLSGSSHRVIFKTAELSMMRLSLEDEETYCAPDKGPLLAAFQIRSVHERSARYLSLPDIVDKLFT
ncbi:hypothetical protein EVAR_4612_1 [Eumeta japonica]|uniref:Uncharacterized protein n=1 Tax=Eumeta variegata TaxID=151549 RepID=A0A4C1SX19_EUMVA|nr:hypothetical protein EVAR_4612_1 [Eumeta japonica]